MTERQALPPGMTALRVLVCGSRKFRDRALVNTELDRLLADRGIRVVIEGGSTGADRLAREWAYSRSVSFITFPANWMRYGRAAGPIRNTQMLREGHPDLVVAFPGGDGTKNMKGQAWLAGVEVIEVPARKTPR
jgi:predicted Rossmann-fold nucleotide-binding protein